MHKKTSDTMTMTRNDKHIIINTDLTTGLTQLDQQCNRTKTNNREEKIKSYTLQKSAILPSLRKRYQIIQ